MTLSTLQRCQNSVNYKKWPKFDLSNLVIINHQPLIVRVVNTAFTYCKPQSLVFQSETAISYFTVPLWRIMARSNYCLFDHKMSGNLRNVVTTPNLMTGLLYNFPVQTELFVIGSKGKI